MKQTFFTAEKKVEGIKFQPSLIDVVLRNLEESQDETHLQAFKKRRVLLF